MSIIDPVPPASTPPALDTGADWPGQEPLIATGRGLTESGDPYRLLFDSNPNPMWVYDLATLEFLAVNEAALDVYGYTRDEFLAMTIKDIRPSEDVPALERRLREGTDLDVPSTWRHRKKDGSLIEVEVRSSEIELGGRRCRLVLVNDVTERLAAERAFRESELRYRELIENASDVVYTHSIGGEYTELNEAARRTGFYDTKDGEALNALSLVAPEYHELVQDVLDRLIKGESVPTYEIEVIGEQGRRVPVEVNSWLLRRDDKPVAIQGIVRDISRRRQAEEALRESERRYRVISDLISDYAYVLNVTRDGQLVLDWITGSFTRDLGYTAEELNERGVFSIVYAEDYDVVAEAIASLGETERSVRELRLVAKSGETFWVRFYTTLVRDDRGRPTHIVGAGQNITDRRVAEEALQEQAHTLQESERRFRALIENSSEAVMLWDADSIITYVTPSTTRILGYHEDELVGHSAFDSIHRDDRDAIRAAVEFSLANPGKNVRGTFRVMRRDGDWRWIEGVGKNLMDDPGVGAIVTTFRDVTERVNAERDLKSSLELLQKVDSERRDLMARLVNAQEEERERIAMDIHDESIQVMTAVSMRLEVLQRHLTDPAQADACRQLQDSVRRCIASLRELIFEVHPHALEQYGLVSSLSQLLAKAAREVGLEYELNEKLTGEPPAEVRLVVYRIVQEALTNVLRHARARKVSVTLAEENDGIRGTIVDDGVGFFPEEAAQPSAGHLGLAAMRARAETVGGWWRLDSKPGSGATVEFWVPMRPNED